METPYNPLDKANLGISVREALLKQVVAPMKDLLVPSDSVDRGRFHGAGIYAIYFAGEFPLYSLIASRNCNGAFEAPIYVGKAVPKGSRKGGTIASDKPSDALYQRLRIHATGISEAENLDLRDFYFRYLVVDDIWIPLGETYLIDRFKPLWNYVVDGFGNKTPGRRRSAQYASLWDTLHPGRSFVRQLGLPPNPKNAEQIAEEVTRFLALSPDERSPVPILDNGEEE